MPTADRTTIKAAISGLATKLRTNLVADPPTVAAPFRGVSIGAATGDEFARPFLAITLQRARPIAVTDDDRLFEVSMTLTAFVDVLASDPHPTILDAIGAVEDYLDSIVDTGVIAGAEGFDNRTWKFSYPQTTSGTRLASAAAAETFIVKVERLRNREPAP